MTKPRFLSLKELREVAQESPMDFLVDGLLPTKSINNLVGKPKCGKSTLLRQLAASVATGTDFLGRATIKSDVLYFALEEQRSRLWTQFEGLGVGDDNGIYTTTDLVQGDPLEGLGQTLDEMPQVRLIIIDPLFKFMRAKDSNDYAETSALLERLSHFSKGRNITVVCAHHQKKRETDDVGDGALGSTAIRAGSDTNLFLRQDKSGMRSIQTEQRYGTALEPTLLKFDNDSGRFSLDATVSSSEQRLVDEQQQRLIGQVISYISLHPNSTQLEILPGVTGKTQAITDALRRLVNEGLLKRSGAGGKNDPYRFRTSELPAEAHTVQQLQPSGQPKGLAA